jgi:hypothetical protein
MRRHPIGIMLGVLIMASAMIGNHEAFAGTSVGDFEIDGNLQDSPAGGPIDWSTDPEGNIPHPGLSNRTDFTDASGKSDGIFGQGTKELEPGTWKCITGSAPGKSDILKGSVAIRAIGQKRFMYVNFFRLATDGDVHMDYEFNQSSEPNPPCAALGEQAPKKRTAGDVMITFDTELGGKIILVRAFEWVGDHKVGTFKEFSLGSQGVLWDAAVNIPNAIPGAQAGAFGEAAINITDSPIRFLCPEFAYMKTRASTAITSELKDRTAPLKVVFADRPDLALAEKSAFGASVSDTLLGINQTFVPVASHQQGVGRDEQSNQLLDVNVATVPLQAAVLRASSTSEITNGPALAKHTSVSEAVNVNVLNGLVTASFVRGVATANASSSASSISSIGSAFKDLVVNGVAMNNVTPNTRIDLPAPFGKGSYVLLYERVGSTSTPAPGQIDGGTYAADLTVNMIHVVIKHSLPGPGTQTTEVIVSNAVAHADFPQLELCSIPPGQSVSGHAFIASATTDPSLVPTTVGFVSIPATGGLDQQNLAKATIGSAVSAGASESESSGMLTATNSTASSFAQATNVCLATGCAISASVVKSQSNSTADGGASSNDSGTELVGLVVMGTPVSANPPPNTVIDLPGIGFVIVNEQFCDNNGTLANNCSDGTVAGNSGLTVRAIHVFVTVPANPAGLQEGEVIVAEAHSDATFQP